MAVSVTLYKGMRKDTNSTARPAAGNYTSSNTYDCLLYEPCSVQSPKIWIAVSINADMTGYNYAYIPHFSRYYWVTDVSFMDGRWLFSMTCDVLGSFKTEIGSSTQYVLRSQSEYDENIIDSLYTPTGGKGQSFTSVTNPFSPTSGSFVLSYVSQSPVVGSNAYAVMTANQFRIFASVLMGSGSYLNVDVNEISEELTKIIMNPIQYIQSIKYYPFTITGTTTQYTMFFGWWQLPLPNSGFGDISIADPMYRTKTFSFPITRHPQAVTHGKYLYMAPFSQYRLWLPGLSYIDIPADMIYDFNAIQVDYNVDIVTGEANVNISAYESGGDRSIDIYNTNCQLAVDIPIAQITTNSMGLAMMAGGAAISAFSSWDKASGGFLGGLIDKAKAAIPSEYSRVPAVASFAGGVGNYNQFVKSPRFETITQDVTGPAFNLYGRPLCQLKTINTLSGFTMCGSPHVEIAGATLQEIQQIEGYLAEGFRYE